MPSALDHLVLVLPHHHERKLLGEVPWIEKEETLADQGEVSRYTDCTHLLLFWGATVERSRQREMSGSGSIRMATFVTAAALSSSAAHLTQGLH